jgi:tetratricopeptide (TPR) repeat protein
MREHLLLRARLLRRLRRFEDAYATVHEALATNPDSAEAHRQLALVRMAEYTNLPQALTEIDRAISLSPESAVGHAVRAAILNHLESYQDSLLAAREAKRLAPEMSLAWYSESRALYFLDLLPDAEQSVRKALELEPNDSSASNLLSRLLRMQNRLGEAEAEIRLNLQRDPECAETFTEAGWTALGLERRATAEKMFLEALRLNPNSGYARLGLRNAYKQRSALFRLKRWKPFVLVSSRCQKISLRRETVFFTALPGIFWFATGFHEHARLPISSLSMLPFVGLIVLVPFAALCERGFGHFLLMKDPTARLLLDRGERLDGFVIGGTFVGGLVLLLLGITALYEGIATVGAALLCAAAPASRVFGNPSTIARIVFGLAAFVVFGFGGWLALN